MRRDRAANERKAMAALERLRAGAGHHPRHRGISVRVTVAAVAREANLSRATVHRLSVVHDAVRALRVAAPRGATEPMERKRSASVSRIEELQRQVGMLLEENLALTMRLAALDSTFERFGNELAGARDRRRREEP